jgi:hypothetical protein
MTITKFTLKVIVRLVLACHKQGMKEKDIVTIVWAGLHKD